MMSSLKTWLLLLHGGQVISPPGMSLRSADGGRRLCFGSCGGVRRRWNGSIGFLDVPRLISVSPVEVVSDLPDWLTRHAGRRSPDRVPRWRLAWEGPFLAERSSLSL